MLIDYSLLNVGDIRCMGRSGPIEVLASNIL